MWCISRTQRFDRDLVWEIRIRKSSMMTNSEQTILERLEDLLVSDSEKDHKSCSLLMHVRWFLLAIAFPCDMTSMPKTS